jgi:hypothetical protein
MALGDVRDVRRGAAEVNSDGAKEGKKRGYNTPNSGRKVLP